MLKITARIDIGSGTGEIVDATTTSPATDNIQGSSTLAECVGHHTQIQKPFILGRSRLGDGDCYTQKANFFIGKISSKSNGVFSTGYVLNINGNNIEQVTIVFNKRDNQFPKSIIVDGEDFIDDDPQWTIPLKSGYFHTIAIPNWNTPNSPMVISSIYADLSIDIDETNLLDFERSLLSKSNYKQPSFGIISNSGSLSFIDIDGEVRDYITQQIINSKNTISIYLVNGNTNAKEQIGYFNTQEWSYNTIQSIVDITLKDDLEEWQSINVPAINYVPTVSTSQTAEWLYNQLYAQTPSKYNMLSFDELDSTTQAVLSGTTIQYPLLESDNLWAEWNKLCELCFLNIYKNDKGRTVCKYNNGE